MSWIAEAHAEWHAVNFDHPWDCPLDCYDPCADACGGCGAPDGEDHAPSCSVLMDAVMAEANLRMVPAVEGPGEWIAPLPIPAPDLVTAVWPF